MTVRASAGWLTALAARAEAPVFLARGIGAADADARLRASPRLRVVDSPRAATVLLVVGYVPNELAEPLARVHDQMAHPRATVWWTGDGDSAAPADWSHATIVGPRGDIEAAVVAAHCDVITGGRSSEPPLLPDADPAPWRGVGPYGHGGTGMTGGIPYGRPLAGRADDRRDRLALDVVRVRIGPFFPHLPEGLVLEVTFAGDVVHDLTVKAPPAVGDGGLGVPLPDEAVIVAEAADRPVTVAAIEHARARQHLRWLARFLHLYGLDALARLVAVEAVTGHHDPKDLTALARRLDRCWALGRSTRGVGVINGADAALWGGPVARAAGFPGDARAYSTVYATLGFQPIVHANGDNRDRWRQRLAEAVQAIELAERAGTAVIEHGETIEPAAPPPPARFGEQLAATLIGAEWGDAVAIVASVDPDVNAVGYLSTGTGT